MTPVESWLSSLDPSERSEAAADLVRMLHDARGPEPKAKPVREPTRAKSGPKNLTRGSRTATIPPATRLEVMLELDPEELAEWLLDLVSVPQDSSVGVPGSADGWRTPLAVYLKSVLGVGARVEQMTLYMLIGSQEYACPLPAWARRFVQACEHEPRGPILATQALTLLQYARETGAN